MDDRLRPLPRGSWVAFIRLRSLGDTLLMTPAAAALKAWRPDLRLAALLEPRFAALIAHNPDFDQLIPVPASLPRRLRALQSLRRLRPQLALGLHGGTTAAWLTRLSGAPVRAGFAGLRHAWAYNHLAPMPPPPPGRSREHTVEQVLSLLVTLGLPRVEPGPLRFVLRPEARARIRQRLAQRGITGAYAFLSTEAREPAIRWPLERFSALAAWLRTAHGLSSVQASAGAGEPAAGATLLSGTSVEELAALIAESALVVGNDGGPVHIAAAFGKPVFVVYSTTDVDAWYPWQTPCVWIQRVPIGAISAAEVVAALAAFPPLAAMPTSAP